MERLLTVKKKVTCNKEEPFESDDSISVNRSVEDKILRRTMYFFFGS